MHRWQLAEVGAGALNAPAARVIHPLHLGASGPAFTSGCANSGRRVLHLILGRPSSGPPSNCTGLVQAPLAAEHHLIVDVRVRGGLFLRTLISAHLCVSWAAMALVHSFFFFLAVLCGLWDLSSQPGTEPTPTAVQVWSLNP